MTEPPTASDDPGKCADVPPLPHLVGAKSRKLEKKASMTRIAQLVTGIVLSTYAIVMFYNILQNPTIGFNGQGVGIMLMSGIWALVGVKAIIKSFKREGNAG